MSSDSWRSQVQRAPRSVLITIKNYTHIPLARINYNLQSGTFRLFPQEIIPPYAEVQFASTSKGLLSDYSRAHGPDPLISGTDGTVIYKAMVAQHDISFAFWFRNPFVDPRQAKCTVEQPDFSSKFQLQQSEEEATPVDASSLESTDDQAWMKEQTKASRSVTITVRNNSARSFYRKKYELNRGSWTCLPPDVFLPGRTVSFGAKGSLMTGTTGRVVYQSEDSNDSVEIFYDNPFIGDIQVVHSRPLDFRLDVAYRKQEHLRINVGIFPLSESVAVERETEESTVLSSSPSSSAGSALPLHKVQPLAVAKQVTQVETTNSPKLPSSSRSPKLPLNQLVSGEEDEEDAAAAPVRTPKGSADSPTPRSKSKRQLTEEATSVPKLRRQGTSDKLSSSSSRVSLDLVHNAARFRLFGVPLAVIVEKENSGENVPKLVSEICSHISSRGAESVGVFVQPGSLREVLAIRAEYERGDSDSPDLSRFQLHSVATVLKMFLRELPTPLIPPKQHAHFVEFVATDVPPTIPAAQFYTKFVASLPSGHKETLRTLFKMLKSLGMSPGCDLGYEDSGVVFAPIICPDSAANQRLAQWTGAIVARAINVALECLDDVDFGAISETIEHEVPPTMLMSASPKLKSRNSSRSSDSSKSKGSPKSQKG